MYRAVLLLLLCPALYFGQLSSPRIGFVRYANAEVHAVYGVPASFVIGDSAFSHIESAAFSDKGGIVAGDGQVRIVAASGDVLAEHSFAEHSLAEHTSAQTAITGINGSLESALAFFPGSQTLLHLNGDKFERTLIEGPIAGRVLSLYASGDTAVLLVAQSRDVSELRVSLVNGELLSENFLEGVEAPAAYLGEDIVYAGHFGLEVRSREGSTRSVPFDMKGTLSFEPMANSWIHVTNAATGQQWALEVTPKRLHLSELPFASRGARP